MESHVQYSLRRRQTQSMIRCNNLTSVLRIQFSGELNAITSCATTKRQQSKHITICYCTMRINTSDNNKPDGLPWMSCATLAGPKYMQNIYYRGSCNTRQVHQRCNNWNPYAFVQAPCRFCNWIVRPLHSVHVNENCWEFKCRFVRSSINHESIRRSISRQRRKQYEPVALILDACEAFRTTTSLAFMLQCPGD